MTIDICERLLSTGDSLNKLPWFLANWYHITDNVDVEAGPSALLSLYKNAGNHLDTVFICNRITPPHELDFSQSRIKFYIEGQGVCSWAFENGPDDPHVWLGHHDTGTDPVWTREEERLSGFILQACLFEAIMGAPNGAWCSWCNPDETQLILRHWHRIPTAPWRWPTYPTTFWCARGALAIISPNEEAYTIRCGARSSGALDFMKPFIDDSWEYSNL